MTTLSTRPAVTTPPARPRPPLARPRAVGWARVRPVVLPVIGLLIALLFVSPYLVMLLDALRPSGDVLASPPTFFPRHWRFSSFGDVIGQARFRDWLYTSVLVSVTSTLLVLAAAIPAAYVTARFRFPGRGMFLLLVLATQMFSPTSLVVGIYREAFELNLVNTYLALIITNSAFNLAFAVWMLHGFMSSVPVEVEEAAHLDGCNRLSTLRRVVLPLVKPGLVTVTIFTFIAAWNEYVVALTLMQDDSKKPLPVGINSYVTGYSQHWDQLFAAALIAVVPVVVLFGLVEKHLVNGLTAGSVK
jgi:multiple sugar transport system permease protein